MTLAPDLVSPWSDRFVCVGACLAVFWIPSSFISLLPALSLTLPWGYKEMTPKAGRALGRGVLETSLTGTHSASELRKTRDRIKSPPLILSVPQPAYSLGSLLLSFFSS